MDSKKICPLRLYCSEDNCAWYIEETKTCAVKTLAKANMTLALPIQHDNCCNNYYFRSRKA